MRSTRQHRTGLWRLVLALLGIGVVSWAIGLSARFYTAAFSLVVLAISAVPYLLYISWVRRPSFTIGTGLGLLASTLWTYGSFAVVPDESRDGVEAMWILLGLALNLSVVVLGALADRGLLSTRERS